MFPKRNYINIMPSTEIIYFSSDTPQITNVRNRPKQWTNAEIIPRCGLKCINRKEKGDRIKQHVPTNIRQHNFWQREQPPRGFKQQPSLKHDSPIGQHLLDNPNCAENYDCFKIIGKARSLFQLGVFKFVHIKTERPVLCRQKLFVFSFGPFN